MQGKGAGGRQVAAKPRFQLAGDQLDLVGILTSDVLIIASRIMRTTLDIDDPILKEVRALHEREGRSMGAIVSELLAEALARRRPSRARLPFRWTSRPMKALVDLTDKETVYAALDAERP